VRLALVEDAEDIHAFEDRATDSVLDFEEFVKKSAGMHRRSTGGLADR
jgi:hypothetical protein